MRNQIQMTKSNEIEKIAIVNPYPKGYEKWKAKKKKTESKKNK